MNISRVPQHQESLSWLPGKALLFVVLFRFVLRSSKMAQGIKRLALGKDVCLVPSLTVQVGSLNPNGRKREQRELTPTNYPLTSTYA